MKLFIHDEKHEQVIAELDLGKLSASEIDLIDIIIRFLDNECITTRYCNLVLAESYDKVICDEDENMEIKFS